MSIITLNTGTQSHFAPQGGDVQGSINLDRLSDVTVTNVQDNQILKYDSVQGLWVNTSTGAVTALGDLSDVTITGVSDGEVLQYNSTSGKWENQAITVTNVDGGTY